MRMALLIATILLVLPACTIKPKPATAPAQPVVHRSQKAASAWFDVEKRLHSQVCLVTPNGMDIRQSAYLEFEGAADSLVVARVRDYENRQKGQPDEQWLVQFSPGSGKGTQLEIPEGVFAGRFIVSADHRRLCLGGITQAEDGSWGGPASLSIWDSGTGPQVLRLSGPVVVQRFTSQGTVICLEIPATGLSGGLLAPAIDWASPLQEVVPKGCSPGTIPPSWQMSPSLECMAKQTVTFDPAKPADAVVHVELRTVGEPPEIFKHSFPYNVSYAAFQWEPSSAWADGATWVVKEFRPDPTGKQSRANHRGAYSLVAYSSPRMERTHIVGHVEASLPFVAANGLVFYTLQRPGAEGDSWEVWVSSTDGLDKRLIWRIADAQYVAVSDYLPEGRLLTERQYFTEEDGRPRLHSELREISLIKLNRSQSAVDPEDVVGRIINKAASASAEPSLGIPPRVSVPDS